MSMSSGYQSSWSDSEISYLPEYAEYDCKAFIREFGFGESVPELPVEFFLQTLLPDLRQGLDVDEVIEKLQSRRPPEICNGRWGKFVDDPQSCRHREAIAFKPLERLACAIAAESTVNGAQPLLVFQNNPNRTPATKMQYSTSRPDGYFVLRDRPEGKDSWADIALCAGYRKLENVENRNDNVKKVMWGIHHCLREDPRRRFTFGMTIENTDMRIWFCSRAELLVSQAFNFITEHRTFVHFFLAIMYAKPHEVGWDPTMKVVMNDEGQAQCGVDGLPRFDILVQSKEGTTTEYRTMRLLSDIGADFIRGRGTRVWEAKRLEGGEECGTSVALKDSWISDDREREGNVLDDLHQVSPDAEERDILDLLLLTVVCHGDVYIDTSLDHTRKLMTRGATPSRKRRFQLQRKLVPFTKSSIAEASHMGAGGHRTPEERIQATPEDSPSHHSNVHYRIVFQEICKPIYTLTSLSAIFDVLVQMTFVLQVMHEHGWVHRDISIGNILVHHIDGRLWAKLSDLEYTKKIDEQGIEVHESRTGTLNFMSMEVDSMAYSFRPDTPGEYPYVDPSSTLGSRLRKYMTRGPARPQAPPKIPEPVTNPAAGFRYNPLHDLESIWWVAMYFVVNKSVVAVGDTPVRWEDQEQRKFARALFYTQAGRGKIMQEVDYFKKHIRFLQDSVKLIASYLQRLRELLVDRYREVERDPVVNHATAASGLHILFSTILEDIVGELQDNDITIDTFRDRTAQGEASGALNASEPMDSNTGKRGLEDAEDDLSDQTDGITFENSSISARPAARKKSKKSHPRAGPSVTPRR